MNRGMTPGSFIITVILILLMTLTKINENDFYVVICLIVVLLVCVILLPIVIENMYKIQYDSKNYKALESDINNMIEQVDKHFKKNQNEDNIKTDNEVIKENLTSDFIYEEPRICPYCREKIFQGNKFCSFCEKEL